MNSILRQMKRVPIVGLTLGIVLLTGCTATENVGGNHAATSTVSGTTSADSTGQRTNSPLGFQFDMPQTGEQIVVINTSMGVIKARLFPNDAPQTVANFEGLVGEKYYDGSIFHRVINDFMIQGGKPASGAEKSFSGQPLPLEVNDNLRNFRGSLAMARTSDPNSAESEFFINQNPTVTADTFTQYGASGYQVSNLSDAVKTMYEQHGGNPFLDDDCAAPGSRGYAVFGQVFDGMDVVDKIASASVDSNDQPLTAITMTSVTLETYEG